MGQTMTKNLIVQSSLQMAVYIRESQKKVILHYKKSFYILKKS
jgi:hypothetical protein